MVCDEVFQLKGDENISYQWKAYVGAFVDKYFDDHMPEIGKN